MSKQLHQEESKGSEQKGWTTGLVERAPPVRTSTFALQPEIWYEYGPYLVRLEMYAISKGISGTVANASLGFPPRQGPSLQFCSRAQCGCHPAKTAILGQTLPL